jgi:hypothetical protein
MNGPAFYRWMILGALLALAAPAIAQARFKNTANVRTSPQPQFVAAADFNNDGIPDLAVSLSFPNNVAVLLGAGDGTFPTRFVFGSGFTSNFSSLAIGDFNEDGNLDIGLLLDDLIIFAGNGDGTFHLLAQSKKEVNSVWAAVADFNHDGHLDVATANNATSDVSVLLGNGDGTFQTATRYPLVSLPLQIVAADFNNDGYADLAVTLVCTSDPRCPNGEVSVLLNNRDGSFQSPKEFAAGATTSGLAAADLNRDGNTDLVATNVGGVGTASVFLGRGDGTFNPAVNYDTAAGAIAAAVADFDEDGKLDLAIANAIDNSVSLLRGDGDGTFQAARSFPVGSEPAHVLAADLNHDGAVDLVFPLLAAKHIAVFTNQHSAFASKQY